LRNKEYFEGGSSIEEETEAVELKTSLSKF
jgi:hypothetical protein